MMPTISVFLGIMIRMYTKDHPPPHFHAFHGEHEAQIAIETGEIIEGELPRMARRVVKEWTDANRERLAENWRRREMGLPLERIDGHISE